MAISTALHDHPMFAVLSPDLRQEAARQAVHRRFRGREFLVYEGQPWPYFFYVIRGEIAAMKESSEGRALTATTLKRGEVFWGLAFFHRNMAMPVSLIAQSEVEILLWSRDYLEPLIKRHGEMSWILCQLMISRMLLASEVVEGLAFQPVLNRLAGLVLDMFGETDDGFRERELTLDEMASRIGSTREMVCRQLQRLGESGAIEIRRTQLRINDRAQLEKTAGR